MKENIFFNKHRYQSKRNVLQIKVSIENQGIILLIVKVE